jgi:hypothetical protein
VADNYTESASVREWTDLLSRCRFGTVAVAGKNLTSAKVKAIAFRLAMYADSDGSRVRPGMARLAVDVEADPGTVKRVVQLLARVGLLTLVREGTRPGHADEYRLTIPTDLVESVDVWSPTEHARETERLRARLRGRYPSKPDDGPRPRPTDLRVPEAPADDASCGSLEDPQMPSDPPDLRVPGGPAEPSLRVPEGRDCGSLGDPPPTTYLDTKTTEPTQRDLDTAVTPSRATASGCETHGSAFTSGRRGDGLPACPLCRRFERRARDGLDGADPPHLRLVQGGAA